MSGFLSQKYNKLEAYVPGEQPKDMQYVKLNTNELPYPPSPRVLACLEGEVERLNLYPDPTAKELRQKMAENLGNGLTENNICLTNGSDDALNFAFMAYCDEKTGAAFPDISYGFYSVFAKLHNIDYVEIPLEQDFSIDVKKYANLGRTIFIANPNAPTGLLLSLSEIEFVLKNNPDNIVVIDEAYIDFGGESAVSLIPKYKNLLVVGTYSKSKALAGGRLGFAVGNAEIISDLELLRNSTNPYNINRLTMKIGIETQNSLDYYREKCQIVCQNRENVTKTLEKMGFFVLESKANFIFARHTGGLSGELIYKKLKEKGVLVRHFTGERIKEFNRITIGTKQQNAILIEKLNEIIEENL